MLDIKNKRSKLHLVIYILIGLGIFLRLWKFSELFQLGIDEEKAGFIIKGITDFTHFPLVGHPSSIGFRLGPLQYYILAPFYKIFSSSPLVWGYLSVLTSVVSMILIFKIASVFGKTAGIVSLVFYAVSFLNIIYDRRGWQVSFHSLIALTILFSLIKMKKNHNNKYIYLLMIFLILASQFEIATLLFLPLTIITLNLLKIKPSKKDAFICLLLFFYPV